MLFRVLGPLEVVHVDGRRADIPAGAAEHVLSALLLRPNTWVSADSLAEAVWPDRTSPSPAKELWPYVHDLCRRTPLFGETSARIESMCGRHRLNIGEGELDSIVFERLVHDGRAVLATDPQTAARCFRAAADLWRGTPFASLNTYHSRAETERLTRLRWAALDHLVDALVAMDHTAGSVTLLQALTAEDPKRERTWLRLVEVLTHAGRPIEAAAASRKAARVAGTPSWDAR
ncbi:DNA-binding transcriptional activator of the SARP family [Lentzea xinjiangensis]|uniref:DNA-binding transcriptional activator of the SARP family n=1 Tax=Lentzea xinjiangensis TaxID=402600 RepID=A0A1H9NLR6_9PSEU|nr:BTAD domain-containing putative transcriptional regulator [Lentzea xinjiangensis]SER36964.1 DNA-binding transcriptional activator of the SARP family [Lentzea xinjiangensis]